MSQYYYLAASLPTLSFEGPLTLGSNQFDELCREQLSLSDYRLVSRARLAGLSVEKYPSAALTRWNRWEISLRNELVMLRAHRQDQDPHRFLIEAVEVPGLAGLAQEAFGTSSPLEAESIMDRARWRFLDELELGHYFDTEKLIIYSLRLQIVERRASMSRETGEKEFGRISESVKEQIYIGELI